MHKPTDTGMNRTGVGLSPIDSARTVKGARAQGTPMMVDGQVLEAERVAWARDAEPVGTVPPPSSVKGAMKTVLEKLQGHQPTVFIDKLGERLQFERTGTRLYDAILAKFEAADVHEGGPTRGELEQIREDERRHFLLIRDCIRELGADPTAVTPCADVTAIAGLGWVQAITDPRTTLTQCLGVILIAEAADADGWQLLVRLAETMGFDEMAEQFRQALVQEELHAAMVRTWIENTLVGQAGVAPTPSRDDGSGVSRSR